MNVLKYQKLNEHAVAPKYANPGDSGFDLYAVKDVLILPGETVIIPTGLSFELEPGWEIQVRPRSGNSTKTKLRVANSPGTVDSGYRGEAGVIMDNINCPYTHNKTRHAMLIDNRNKWDVGRDIPEGAFYIRKGDRIAQAVVAPVAVITEFQEVQELSQTDRGDGGFGSTGVR